MKTESAPATPCDAAPAPTLNDFFDDTGDPTPASASYDFFGDSHFHVSAL